MIAGVVELADAPDSKCGQNKKSKLATGNGFSVTL
jgi:hypothetical protein